MWRIGVGVLGVVVAAGVGGCGHSGSSGAGVTTGPVVTAGSGGMDQVRGVYGRAIKERGTADVDTRTQNAGGSETHTETCRVRYVPAVASDCMLNKDGQEVHQISLPDALYLSVPSASLPAGSKPWVRFNTNPITTDKNDVVRTLSQSPGSDDSVLAPGVSTVTAVAPDPLNGKQATRCDLRIDLPTMYRSEADRATNPRIRQLLLERANNSTGTAKAALWIDSAGLPAQLRLDLPAGNGPNQRPHPAVTETVSYRDWGAPVTVTAPPADQVGTPN